MTTPDKPLHRWLRFSLRSLLLLVLVIAVSLGWLSWKLQRAKQQGITVAALKEMGCSVEFDYENTAMPIFQNSSSTVLERLRKLLVGRSVTGVNGYKSQITDAGLVHLKGLPRLTELHLGGPQITDAGLVHLEGLPQLTELSLGGPQVTDAGLVHIKGLTQLLVLDLRGTQVTDDGLVHLKGLTQLQALVLSGTTITDAGMEQLRGLTKLQTLSLV